MGRAGSCPVSRKLSDLLSGRKLRAAHSLQSGVRKNADTCCARLFLVSTETMTTSISDPVAPPLKQPAGSPPSLAAICSLASVVAPIVPLLPIHSGHGDAGDV